MVRAIAGERSPVASFIATSTLFQKLNACHQLRVASRCLHGGTLIVTRTSNQAQRFASAVVRT
ncbi:hypothetical protein C8Q76DRAFT_248293 [Earliella scabrosa]|nr:hypothetical protein C8Q76DRAFT_248293 [Earliella scabrosa]